MMAGRVLLVTGREEGAQAGQPPAQLAAWILDIPDGSNATAVAANFANSHAFPVGTTARVLDLSDPAQITLSTYQLTSQWEPTDG